MKVIGLTGPVAAGKNEVARILRQYGAFIIDADELAHGLYASQSSAWHEIVKTFGSKVLNRGGTINRKKLGEIVFSDKRMLKRLNGIVHPHLKEAIIQTIDQTLPAGRQGLKTTDQKPFIIINAAVLKEIGLADYVDEVWLVTASKEKRLKRLIKSGLSKEEAIRRIGAQAPQKDYLKMADVVIRNEGTLKQLNAKIRAYFQL